MSEADTIRSGRPLPKIAAAYAGADRLLHVVLRYPDGVVEKIVDLGPVFASGWVYAPLRDDDVLFASMRVNEGGNALEFGDGRKISAAQIERLPQR